MSRRLALVLAALCALTCIATGTTAPATAAKKPHGRLTIVITGLAHGTNAHITAKRPHHKALKATKTKTFKKAALGKYTITIKPIRGYSQSAKKLKVRVKAHHHKTVKIHFTRLRLKFTQLTAGIYYTCGVAADHTAWCWGENYFGELGSTRNIAADAANPVMSQVPGGAVWASLAAGGQHTCGVRLDHSLWCWGWNRDGQLGNSLNVGSDVANPRPLLVSGGKVWSSVTAGVYHTCAIRIGDRSAWCWGSDTRGQLGSSQSNPAMPYVPVPVGTGGAWQSLSAGGRHTCGIRSDRTAWCWGANNKGQLGNPANSGSTDPTGVVPVSGAGTWSSVSANSDFTCGRRTDNTALCWGANDSGQLGAPSNTGPNPSPGLVYGGGTWRIVSAGGEYSGGGQHVCGVKTDGTTWCWGSNSSGALGDGTVGADSATPVKAGGPRFSSVVADGYHTCALSQGVVWCWGNNWRGQIGPGTTSGNSTDMSPNPLPLVSPWAVR